MAFDTYEESLEQSQPVEIYIFQLGSEFFRYTSAEAQVSVGPIVYEPLAITRRGINQGPEEREQLFEVEMPTEGTIAERYVNIVPGPQATVRVERFQRLDGATPQRIVIFDGAVHSVSFKQQAKVAVVACQTLIAATSKPMPRFVYSSACNHVLYDSRCKVDRETGAFKHQGVVGGINGNVLTVPGLAAFGNGWFQAGLVQAFSGTDARMILKHTGDDITLLLPFPIPVTGTIVQVYAGCAHDPTTCQTKFSNLDNYGGFPFVPVSNPFEVGL